MSVFTVCPTVNPWFGRAPTVRIVKKGKTMNWREALICCLADFDEKRSITVLDVYSNPHWVELKKDALEVLRIYQAVPSTSVALKSVSHIVVGGRSKSR